MERDFMGLNSKEPMASVKQEITDEGPEAQWPFMKNSSFHPNSMSFRAGASQDDGMKKMVSLPNTSSAIVLPATNFTYVQQLY